MRAAAMVDHRQQESGFYQPIQLSGICLDFNHSNFGKSEFSLCIFDSRNAQISSKGSLCTWPAHLNCFSANIMP